MAFVPLELRDLSGGVEEEQSTSFIEGGLKTLPGHPWTPPVIKHWSSYLSEMMASSAMIIQSYTDHRHQTSFECCSQHQSVDCWLLYKPLRHIDCNLVGGQRRRQGDVEEEQEEHHPACLQHQHSQRKHTSRGVFDVDSCTVVFTKLYLSDPASGYNKGQLILTQTVHAQCTRCQIGCSCSKNLPCTVHHV